MHSVFADELRRAGHSVPAPDLYDGHTFVTLDDGMAYAGQLVYAGFSLGVLPAQFVESAEHAELFLYPMSSIASPTPASLPDDADAAPLLSRRVLDFVRTR